MEKNKNDVVLIVFDVLMIPQEQRAEPFMLCFVCENKEQLKRLINNN